VIDPRLAKLARVLVHYSLGVKKGHWVKIRAPYLAEDLLREIYREVLSAGGHPDLDINIPDLRRLKFTEASDEQLQYILPTEKLLFDKIDRYLVIMGGWNSREMSNIDPKRISIAQKAQQPLFRKMLNRTSSGSLKWCGTQYPTHSSAQDAEMSLTEYEEFVFKGGLLDKKDPVAEWKKISARQAKLVTRLSKIKTIRIVGKETDLSFNVAGRSWVNCDGKLNFPDGEIFTCPVENSAEGHILYTFPAVYQSMEVHNTRLTFKKGKVVEATATKNEPFLHAMLGTDKGARFVGELAFGTNYAIKQFSKNTLFDEKIGGTMHIALGASIPEGGGKNKSAIHWDMVCDTRKGFVIYGDDKPIHKNGKFLF
jgi:aminopeptidase